ncbi:hypothetical protein L249_1375 [Ophiocordyceps polyrhachis-furcata BCC 54312]|uniref:2EXR domain-containing protein n=1 Tax=Ophiocordyceps polyrhachis-furcata BCC 54312 TaxID=1330021 RepID=A0A367KZJ0_9HYPO|nr:hypothetical protein L249_1375 [Ophiocordyceps polyrhachis-furcata BCC 54312]
MAPTATSFELFPRLPCELRLQVWKLAIRPPGAGVHRLSIILDSSSSSSSSSSLLKKKKKKNNNSNNNHKKKEKTKIIRREEHHHHHHHHQHVAAVPPGDAADASTWTRGNSSASLWDAGLWTACVESRQVMMRHFRLRHWQDAGRSLLEAGGYWSPAAVAEEFQEMTTMAVARNDDTYHVVQPHRDLFWLEPQDWKTTVDWRTLFVDLPFTSALQGYGHLSHIGVEFDPSWNVDLPKELAPLLQECTPRGFVARALAECATNRLYSFIWLIDRQRRRRRRLASSSSSSSSSSCSATTTTITISTTTTTSTTSTTAAAAITELEDDDGNDDDDDDDDEDQKMTFYDCNHVYVEVENRDDIDDDEYDKTALCFMQRLGTIADGDYTLMGGDVYGFDFAVDDYLGVLAYGGV